MAAKNHSPDPVGANNHSPDPVAAKNLSSDRVGAKNLSPVGANNHSPATVDGFRTIGLMVITFIKDGILNMKKQLLVLVFAVTAATLLFSACTHKAPSQNRQQAEAIRELGEAYMSEGNFIMALRELSRAEELYPDDPYLQNSLGLAYMARGRHETAVSHFKRAVELNPNYSPARNNLGSAYIVLEEWEKAIECFEEVKDDLMYATPYYSLSNMGYVYYRKGQYETARAYYREALEMERRFPRALHGLGMVALATGDADEAVRRFEQALEVVPSAARIHLDLGRAYEQKHEYSKALNAYKKAASIEQDSRLGDEAEKEIKRLRSRW